jgi:hypothetical protein
MTNFNTQIWLHGTLVELDVEYSVLDDVCELEQAEIIGVYHPGDNPRLRDYTSLNTNIPLWVSEMSDALYDELLTKAEENEDIIYSELDPDYGN